MKRYGVEITFEGLPGDKVEQQMDALAVLMDAEFIEAGTLLVGDKPVRSLSYYLMGKKRARAFLDAAKEYCTLLESDMHWEPKNMYLYLARERDWSTFWLEVGTSLRR